MALRGFARARQRVVCVRGNSHAEATRRRVLRALRGGPVDVLFLDGDHRCDGVKADFTLYAPPVRPGRAIAFHDIVPDRRQTHGDETVSDAGGVPVFWRELRDRFGPSCEELVERADQDGCGIGVITWSPDLR